jgi:hypothetical protein
MLIDS